MGIYEFEQLGTGYLDGGPADMIDGSVIVPGTFGNYQQRSNPQ